MNDVKKSVLILDNEHIALNTYGSNLLLEFTVTCCTKSAQLWREVAAKKVDLIVLDLKLGEDDVEGETIIPKLKEKGIPVIVISGKNDPATILYCRNLGASGFMVKGESPIPLPGKVMAVLAGGECFDVELPGDKVARFRACIESLTRAEKVVFEMYHKGMSAPAIADKISKSVSTVNNRCSAILSKFGVGGRDELMAEAVRSGYLTIDSIDYDSGL